MKFRLTRRRKIVASSLVLAALAAWFEPTGVVRGWLRGEAFYEGRPTNYWSRELARWQYSSNIYFTCHTWNRNDPNTVTAVNEVIINRDAEQEPIQVAAPTVADSGLRYAILNVNSNNLSLGGFGSYTRTPGIIDKVSGWFGVTRAAAEQPALLSGDPAGEAVLRELLEDPDPTTRANARRALDEMARGKAP